MKHSVHTLYSAVPELSKSHSHAIVPVIHSKTLHTVVKKLPFIPVQLATLYHIYSTSESTGSFPTCLSPSAKMDTPRRWLISSLTSPSYLQFVTLQKLSIHRTLCVHRHRTNNHAQQLLQEHSLGSIGPSHTLPTDAAAFLRPHASDRTST